MEKNSKVISERLSPQYFRLKILRGGVAPENHEGLKKQSNTVSTLTFPADH